jgi:phospholipase C
MIQQLVSRATILSLLIAVAISPASGTSQLGSNSNIQQIIVVKTSPASFDSVMGWAGSIYSDADAAPQGSLSYADESGTNHPTVNLSPRCDINLNQYSSPNTANADLSAETQLVFYADGSLDGYAIGYNDEDTNNALRLGYYTECGVPVTAFMASHFSVIDDFYGCYLAGPFANRICGISGTTDRLADFDPVKPSVTVAGTDYMFNSVDIPTIFDALATAEVSAGYYYIGDLPFLGAFGPIVAGVPRCPYQQIIHPLSDFSASAAAGTLPHVSYVDLSYNISVSELRAGIKHPDNVLAREAALLALFREIRFGPQWNTTFTVIVPDYSGGYFDHANPQPVSDSRIDGVPTTGFRVPALVMSETTRSSLLGGGPYDQSSIVNMIAWRWDLEYTSSRNSSNLADIFDSSPRSGAKRSATHGGAKDSDFVGPVGCDGSHFGERVDDACGVCAGNGSTCAGCDGIPNSNRQKDACNVCGGDSTSCMGCDRVPNSGKQVDKCNVCGGDSSSCKGCDGVPNSGKTADMCGVCGGDSSSCRGCDGFINSKTSIDACGVCGGDGSSCSKCKPIDFSLWKKGTGASLRLGRIISDAIESGCATRDQMHEMITTAVGVKAADRLLRAPAASKDKKQQQQQALAEKRGEQIKPRFDVYDDSSDSARLLGEEEQAVLPENTNQEDVNMGATIGISASIGSLVIALMVAYCWIANKSGKKKEYESEYDRLVDTNDDDDQYATLVD